MATINLDLPALTLLARSGQLRLEINVYDIYGRTPIFYVVGPHTNMAIFNFLHERGASLDHVDNRGKTIMDYALLHGNFNVMWRLKNIREKDRIYSTILSNIHDRHQTQRPTIAPQRQGPHPEQPRSSRLRSLRD
ncbi:MAG: ankyrin repeat domain-containing protein [Gammaproteobacteria bacterium]|nr:ankyrin repeat domain-containing protein [Gammaproteobacteria bacterium]